MDTPEGTGAGQLWMTTDGLNPAPDLVDTRNRWAKEARRQAERDSAPTDYCHG